MTNVAAIHKKLDALADSHAQHVRINEEAHARVEKRLDDHIEREARLESMLTGNGDVGALEEIRELKRWTAAQRRLLWILVPAFLLGAGALVWQAIVFYVTANNG